MRIINIIDRFDSVNFGIWNAAIATAPLLKETYGVDSELWYPKTNYSAKLDAKCVPLNIAVDTPAWLIEQKNLNTQSDIIVTHGCWQYPTRWGFAFKKLGFKWVYVPHGMLEPWSRRQKWLQKRLYFNMIEGRYASKSDIIRAVGKPEHNNLRKQFEKTVLIANGSSIVSNFQKDVSISPRIFLFMSRLHHKKGIIPLVKAWKESTLNNTNACKLIIAGPDDGVLGQLKSELKTSHNIEYMGAVFGEAKHVLLQSAHFFVLPSFSEGFPTSVVEAMQYGLVPIISEGCNFPEVFDQNMALKVSPTISSIKAALAKATDMDAATLDALGQSCKDFAALNYSLEAIAALQYSLYNKLISEK